MHVARACRINGFRLCSIAVVLLLGCLASKAATKVVSDADKGATVRIGVHDRLVLRLDSNPTTGYEWKLHPNSTPLLDETSHSQTQATEPGVGRPIVEIFRFKPTGKGTGVLVLHYLRSWEQPDPNDQQFELNVTIE
jgi:inhibitor of cysteine peptidase